MTEEFVVQSLRKLGLTRLARSGARLLSWAEAKEGGDIIRSYAAEQLILLWRNHKNRDADPPLWGDEVEGLLVDFDHENRAFKPATRADALIHELNDVSDNRTAHSDSPLASYTFEAGSFQIEHVPARPWGDQATDFLDVEPSQHARRQLLRSHLRLGEEYLTMSQFPLLGAREGAEVPFNRQANGLQRSQFIQDHLASPYERYQVFCANLRDRRGSAMVENVPIYRDTHTPWPFHDPTVSFGLKHWPEDASITRDVVNENHIFGDAATLGGSSCGLQVTMQARNLDQARMLYDQLIPMTPVLLALTAGTPTFKGYLSDTDTRWAVMADSVDDRTPDERERNLKLRVCSNSTYLSLDERLRPEYQLPDLPVLEGLKAKLIDAGMDETLATHFAHVFTRDPFVIEEREVKNGLDLENATQFNKINGSYWQAVRFKPPMDMVSPDIGWRVEFRQMEIQWTDFENAAFVVFIVLLARTMLHFDLDLYIPIAMVDENTTTANARDAVLNSKFHFRTTLLRASGDGLSTADSGRHGHSKIVGNGAETDIGELTVDEIINGRSSDAARFPGLLPLVRRYLGSRQDISATQRASIEQYLALIENRANGKEKTNARWQRDFIRSHQEYRHDSKVTPGIAYDLLRAVQRTIYPDLESKI